MSRFADIRRNERGVTLVEVLAALVLTVVISGILYSVFAAGLRTYNKIQTEGQLRDEADYMVARLMGELYSADYDDVQYDPASQALSFYSRRQRSFRKDDVSYTYTDTNTPAAKLYIKDGKMILEKQGNKGPEVLSFQSDSGASLLSGSSLQMACTRKQTIFTDNGASSSVCKNGIVRLTLVFQNSGTKPLAIKSEIGF
ncbi:PulJ/GspJ family protein [Ectobacillus ponti]|uniref:Prepilin-type N-terminal cleavage/methylation domain-containing protein n=1 Tax=Ectobacillus ponti TaxID=2961894 RepID=A0AA41X797_9BACI|nr:prepilin-type N-terminal cleavage/methylation domain-containing protein [Ectobacillus ponti]MCP8968493.1 prepilin-type N-terminal cleavage/methylation domain-containing protein [Ectobacillus ponti]